MYLADTNVYLDAVEEAGFLDAFAVFMQRCGPLLVSSMVAAELILGAAGRGQQDAIVNGLTAGSRALAPSAADWVVAAAAVAR
ncbi:MAG TPA: hypothetical protein VFP94_01905, partial [Terriglobales bacterium]|nr:hypothetical protein [Terriglobales bacterium]